MGCPVVLQLGWNGWLAPVLKLRGHQCESLRPEFGLWPWHTIVFNLSDIKNVRVEYRSYSVQHLG